MTLAERRSAPDQLGGGVVLWPNAGHVLACLGLLDEVRAAAVDGADGCVGRVLDAARYRRAGPGHGWRQPCHLAARSVARQYVQGAVAPVYQGFVNWVGTLEAPADLVHDLALEDAWLLAQCLPLRLGRRDPAAALARFTHGPGRCDSCQRAAREDGGAASPRPGIPCPHCHPVAP